MAKDSLVLSNSRIKTQANLREDRRTNWSFVWERARYSMFARSPLSLPQSLFPRSLRSTICNPGHPHPMRTLRITHGGPERAKKTEFRGERREIVLTQNLVSTRNRCLWRHCLRIISNFNYRYFPRFPEKYAFILLQGVFKGLSLVLNRFLGRRKKRHDPLTDRVLRFWPVTPYWKNVPGIHF